MKAREIMSKAVVSVTPEVPLGAAVRLMVDRGIGGLPVVDVDGVLVGIMTEGDLIRRFELGTERRRGFWSGLLAAPGELADDYVRSHGRTVAELMTLRPRHVAEDAALEEVVDLMARHRIKHVPVVSPGGTVLGVVSRTDIVKALAARLERSPAEEAAADRTIRDRILADFRNQPWAEQSVLNISVTDGVVALSGAYYDERERQALRVLIENTPGVRAVEDRLVLVPRFGSI